MLTCRRFQRFKYQVQPYYAVRLLRDNRELIMYAADLLTKRLNSSEYQLCVEYVHSMYSLRLQIGFGSCVQARELTLTNSSGSNADTDIERLANPTGTICCRRERGGKITPTKFFTISKPFYCDMY